MKEILSNVGKMVTFPTLLKMSVSIYHVRLTPRPQNKTLVLFDLISCITQDWFKLLK